MIEGIDLSHWQGGNVDFDGVRESGARFAYLKATQGVAFVDKHFYRNAAHAACNAVLPGAYHFFEPLQSGKEQAQHFASIAEDCTMLRPWIDFEKSLGLDTEAPMARLLDCLEETERMWACAPIIYTGPAFISGIKSPLLALLAKYDLCIAHYTDGEPWVPDPWDDYLIHQYDGDGGKRLKSGQDCDWDRCKDFIKLMRNAESLLR